MIILIFICFLSMATESFAAIASTTAPGAAVATKMPPLPAERIDRMTQSVTLPNRRFVDIRDLLQRLSRAGNFSLMMEGAVHGVLEKVEGTTIEEVLTKTVKPRGFEWRFWENCLFVGTPERMEYLWENLKIPLVKSAKQGNKVSAEFHDIEIQTVVNILENYSGIGLRATQSINQHMSLRVVDMPWEKVLLGVVYLNGFRMVISDFSITITP